MLAALEQFVGGYMSNQMAIPGSAGMYGGLYGAAMQQPPYGQPGFVAPGTVGAHGAYGNMNMQQQVMGGLNAAAQNGVGGGSQQKMNPGTLRMRGIPFRSTVDDVLRFFAGFQVRPRCASITTNVGMSHSLVNTCALPHR